MLRYLEIIRSYNTQLMKWELATSWSLIHHVISLHIHDNFYKESFLFVHPTYIYCNQGNIQNHMYITKGKWIESKLQVFMEVNFNKIL
jgi:hypothetical protein